MKDVGTLAEIGAQVGDVVEVTQWIGSMLKKGDTGVVVHGNTHCKGGFGIGSDAGIFRIITRAKPQGPVITETVKRIVPGVYGKVWVSNEGGHNTFGAYPIACRADLIAARDVFNQLIEAMPDGA